MIIGLSMPRDLGRYKRESGCPYCEVENLEKEGQNVPFLLAEHTYYMISFIFLVLIYLFI